MRGVSGLFCARTDRSCEFTTNNPGEANCFALTYLSRECRACAGDIVNEKIKVAASTFFNMADRVIVIS